MIFADQVPIGLYVFKRLIVKAQQGKGLIGGTVDFREVSFTALVTAHLLPGPLVQVARPVGPLQGSLQRHQPSKLPQVGPGLAQLLQTGLHAGLLQQDMVSITVYDQI